MSTVFVEQVRDCRNHHYLEYRRVCPNVHRLREAGEATLFFNTVYALMSTIFVEQLRDCGSHHHLVHRVCPDVHRLRGAGEAAMILNTVHAQMSTGFVPIMIATIVFNIMYAQMFTVYIEQVRPR